jgi:hypothetical protein
VGLNGGVSHLNSTALVVEHIEHVGFCINMYLRNSPLRPRYPYVR